MGFLESIFGKKEEKDQSMGYKQACIWVDQRVEEKEKRIGSNAESLIKEIANINKKLGESINKLEKKPIREDMDKKLERILKTNKPKYIKSMGRTSLLISKMIESVHEPKNIASSLRSSLDDIGKYNFGEGRYLVVAYQTEMAEIQSKCKTLLELCERIEESLDEGDDMKGVYGVKDCLVAIDALKKDEKRLRSNIDEHQKHISKSKRSIKDLTQEISTIEKKLMNDVSKKMNAEYESAASSTKSIEDTIYSAIARSSRPLRKYSKQSAFHSKLIIALLDDPVATFVETDPTLLSEMLEKFEEAVQDGSLKLKDNGKALARIKHLLEILMDGIGQKYTKVSANAKKLKDTIDSDPNRCEKKRLEDLFSRASIQLDELKSLSIDLKEKRKKHARMSSTAHDELAKSLKACNIEYIKDDR